MFRSCFFSFKVFSPEIQMKFDKITAVAKGFLTRRLLQTEKLKHLKQTVKVRSASLLCSFSSCLFLLLSLVVGRIWECPSVNMWASHCSVSPGPRLRVLLAAWNGPFSCRTVLRASPHFPVFRRTLWSSSELSSLKHHWKEETFQHRTRPCMRE